MPPILKKILLLLSLLATAALIGLGLYALFRKTSSLTGSPTQSPAPNYNQQLPVSEQRIEMATATGSNIGQENLPNGTLITPQGGANYYQPEPVTKIATDSTLYPSLSAGGDMRYHNPLDGKFYRVTAAGSIQEMTDQVFSGVTNVTWAKTKDKAVMEYPDGSKILYNFELKKQVSLPKHWKDFSFSPDSSEIAAKSLGLAPENRWLVVTKDDGSGTQFIEQLGNNADRVTMDWSPSRQTVAFSQTGQPLGADRREVLFVGLQGENFKSTVVEGLDFQPQWSPTGKKLLYSVDSARNNFKPELWIVNAYGEDIGSQRRALELFTWANKCAFADESTLFCAVPRDLPPGAGMSPSIAADTADDIYKIDLSTGLKTIIPTGGDYTVDTLSYNSASNKLFFTDHHQNGIFGVNL